MNLYLVRHADYEKGYGYLKGRLPVELSQKGMEQAKKLNTFFADITIDKIISSAVKRCKQTAEAISDGNIEIEYDKRLLEALIPFQGYMEGSWNEHAYTHEDLGGETVKDVYDRIIRFYNELLQMGYENVIVCSHGDPLYFLYIYLINGKIKNDYNQLRIDYTDYQSKASVRLIEVNKNGEVKRIETILEQEVLND